MRGAAVNVSLSDATEVPFLEKGRDPQAVRETAAKIDDTRRAGIFADMARI